MGTDASRPESPALVADKGTEFDPAPYLAISVAVLLVSFLFLFAIPHKVEPNWGGRTPPVPDPPSERTRVAASTVLGLAPAVSVVLLSIAVARTREHARRDRLIVYLTLTACAWVFVFGGIILYKSIYIFI